MQIKILNENEIREIEEIIEKNYDCKIDLKNYTVFVTRDEKIWLASKDIKNVSLSRCYRIGIYFGKIKRNKKIKLSIEGAFLIGKKAKKNIALIDDKEAFKFLQGYDAEAEKLIGCEINNFVLVKNKNDIIGVGILREKNGKIYIENLIPKARRISF